MKQKSIMALIIILLVTSIILSSCDFFTSDDEEDLAAVVQTSVAQTLTAHAKIEAATIVVEEPTATATATETITPTVTLTPTETLTPTPDSPRLHVDLDTNCRTGPGEPYDIRSALLVGEEAEILGQFEEADYWIIRNPDRPGECWVWGYYATVEGPIDALPYYTQPPTPTPVIAWSGTWTTYIQDTPGLAEDYWVFTVTVDQANNTATGTAVGSAESWGTIQMSGPLSADHKTWSGTWQSAAESGAFLWHLLNPNQFNGNMDGDLYWCGHREGAGRPSPCMYP